MNARYVNYYQNGHCLNNEENIQLIKEYIASNSKEIRDYILVGNIPLVYSITMKLFPNERKERNDLIQVGIIGLIKALDSFDVNKGVYFASYAGNCVANEIRQYRNRRNRWRREVHLDEICATGEGGDSVSLLDTLEAEVNSYNDGYYKAMVVDMIRVLKETLANYLTVFPRRGNYLAGIHDVIMYGTSQTDVCKKYGYCTSSFNKSLKKFQAHLRAQLK